MTSKNRNNLKLIVGLDYGTTYSGLSFALSNASEMSQVFAWTKYPGASSHQAEHCVKAPSRIAFKHENADFELETNAWGYQVESGLTTCSLTKLLLDATALPSKYDDPSIFLASAGHLMRLPERMTAKDVATAYFRCMRQMFDQVINEKFHPQALISLPMEIWLTVPASWSETAKLLTKNAALDAGFAARPIDKIMLISEPEAAAQFALKSSIRCYQDFVKPHTGVMICDCGGGTVDIVSYEVEKIKPTLSLREVAVGEAGKCGGTFIDRNLLKLLKDRLGAAFTSLRAEETGPGSAFMDQFELKKKDFGSTVPSRRAHRIVLRMPLLEHTPEMEQYYEKRSSSILLRHEDFAYLFDPVVDIIIKLIEGQMVQIKSSGDTPVETIVLVGGFGSSPYLKERIAKWCKDRDIHLASPLADAWSAVVCGAVLRGLEGSIVRQKKCRRHYGMELSEPYDSVLHRGYDASKRFTWTDHVVGGKWLTGFIAWEISKGDVVDKDTEINLPFSVYAAESARKTGMIDLLSCSLDTAPETVENSRVEIFGTVAYDLGQLDTRNVRGVRVGSARHCSTSLVLNIRLDDDKGHLAFRVLYNKAEVGKAQIELKE